MIENLKSLIRKWNETGYPNFVLQDKMTGKPSITYTLFYINGIIAVGGLLGRFANLVAGVDADAAKELLIVTGGLYLGRTLTRALSSKPEPTKDSNVSS